MVSRKGIDVKDETHISLPDKYWIGNQTHNTDSILPLFDIRLESHAKRTFISNNLITEFEFSGDLFYNSEHNGTKVYVHLTLFYYRLCCELHPHSNSPNSLPIQLF